MKPTLMKFMTPCFSFDMEPSEIKFSDEQDILVVPLGRNLVPVISVHHTSLGTKKENIEKAEDESPSLFWK